MPTTPTTMSQTQPTLSVAEMAAGMKPWTSHQWTAAIDQWTPFLRDATVHDDKRKGQRMEAACRAALGSKRWDVVLDLLPHTNAHWAGRMAYALLLHRTDLTWSEIQAHHPSHVQELPALLARAVMFEAADRLDEDVVEAMLKQGASLKDQDDQGYTVVGRIADRANSRLVGQTPVAQALMERWLKGQPRVSWSKADIARMVYTEDPDWVLRVLGERPLLSHLYRAVPQAIVVNHASLIRAWLPHIAAQAHLEQAKSAPKRPASELMQDVVRQAVAAGTDPQTLRWIMRQAEPWATVVSFESALVAAFPSKNWLTMEVLWPHVRPEEMLLQATKTANLANEVLDWMVVRSPPGLRDDYLGRCGASALPQAHARQVADHRDAAAAVHEPKRRSCRLRA